MKLKIYLFLAVFLTAAFTANAQIAGTYTGTLSVEVLLGGDDVVPFPNTNVIIANEGTDTYKLSVLDFSFLGLELGNLDVTELTASEEGGIITLSKSAKFSIGPIVEINEISLYTFIYLNSVSIENGVLKLDLNVKANGVPEPDGDELDAANVSFEGENTNTQINALNTSKIAVYPTIANNIVTLIGVEVADYAIYAQNGTLVKAGKTNDGTINVANLGTGIYILNINENSIKIIKK